MIVQHTKRDLQIGDFTRDGDFDAMKTMVQVDTANVPIAFQHKLGRVCRDISIVWKNAYCDFAVVLDAKGQPISDNEQIQLKFSAPATLLLRFA